MSNKIRILFLCDEILQATAGSEQQYLLLNNLDAGEYEIHFALLRSKNDINSEFSTVEPEVLNFNSFKNITEIYRTVVKLRNLIKKHRIQVLHIFFNDSELLASIALRDSKNCRKVVARRNMGYKDSSLLQVIQPYDREAEGKLLGKLRGY